MDPRTWKTILNRTVIVSALGYFVDIYDLLLFLIIRRPSLEGIGIPFGTTRHEDVAILLLNVQMAGLLLGGILWGVLGDKVGRVRVLFGSILLYSVANLANAAVTTVPAYAAARFMAGIGLAGELGAAVTLVSETLPRQLRGYGTAIVASFGILGAVVAALVDDEGHVLPHAEGLEHPPHGRRRPPAGSRLRLADRVRDRRRHGTPPVGRPVLLARFDPVPCP